MSEANVAAGTARTGECWPFPRDMLTFMLDEAAFERLFSPPMRDVTAQFDREGEVWSYVAAIPSSDLQGIEVSSDKIDYVYRTGDDTIEHALVSTSVHNVHLVVVLARDARVVHGHHLLDLNEKFGLGPLSGDGANAAAALCQRYGVALDTPAKWSRVGIALATLELDPLNGVRLLAEGSICGWFFWGGARIPEDADFFQPLHTGHLGIHCPRVLSYVFLPPGWRFLLGANGHEDVWRDETLVLG